MAHAAISWISGRVFLFKDFVGMVEKNVQENGWDGFFKEQGEVFMKEFGKAPDWTEDERKVFATAFENGSLRKVVDLWWGSYVEAREAGLLKSAAEYWEF